MKHTRLVETCGKVFEVLFVTGRSDRPIKLRLSGKHVRDQILESKKHLKDSSVSKDIYISADLSFEEREWRGSGWWES